MFFPLTLPTSALVEMAKPPPVTPLEATETNLDHKVVKPALVLFQRAATALLLIAVDPLKKEPT
jgi:hypothetical protein